MIIVSLLGFFLGGREYAQDRTLYQISGELGQLVVSQLDQILNSFHDGQQARFGIINGTGIFLITRYISRSSFSVTYGADASIIILLALVHYSAAILYLGAEFTR